MSVVVAAAVALTAPGGASATTTVSYSPTTGGLLFGDATIDAVQVIVMPSPDRLRVIPFRFQGVITPLAAGSGCAPADAGRVECTLTGNRVVTARLQGGEDLFEAASNYTGDLFVDGGPGTDLLTGGGGFDRISGGDGDDRLRGREGDDQLMGGLGNDIHFGDGGSGTDTHLGEAGNDTLQFSPESGNAPSADLFDGGAGTDAADYSRRADGVTLKASVSTATSPDDGAPGEGDDLDNVEKLIGGRGNDTLEVRNSFAALAPRLIFTLRGNEGTDTLRAVNNVATSMDGGLGEDTLTGGGAVDTIFSREGERDTIVCGGSLDTLTPDLRDVPVSADCENLAQGDRREGPNVTFRTRVARVGADGALTVRLACPRSVRIGCRGRLAARVDRRGTQFGPGESYSLNAGRSATVQVQLPAGQVAGARRRGARVRVRSIERGVHGPKTTQRSLTARRR